VIPNGNREKASEVDQCASAGTVPGAKNRSTLSKVKQANSAALGFKVPFNTGRQCAKQYVYDRNIQTSVVFIDLQACISYY
jgi:hypothetical protein